MYRHNSQKYTGIAQPTKTTQYSYQIKQESGKPTYNYRRDINTDSKTNYKYGGNNYQPNKTDLQKYTSKNNQLGNIYTSSSNIGRRNQDNERTKITVNKNNYGVVNNKNNTSMSLKVTDSRDDVYNKYRGNQTQFSNYTQRPNVYTKGQIKYKYQAKTNQNQQPQIHVEYTSTYSLYQSSLNNTRDRNNSRQNPGTIRGSNKRTN